MITVDNEHICWLLLLPRFWPIIVVSSVLFRKKTALGLLRGGFLSHLLSDHPPPPTPWYIPKLPREPLMRECREAGEGRLEEEEERRKKRTSGGEGRIMMN